MVGVIRIVAAVLQVLLIQVISGHVSLLATEASERAGRAHPNVRFWSFGRCCH